MSWEIASARRRAIIAATAIFGVLTLLTAASDRFWELLLLRFLNGFALGGACLSPGH